MRSASRKAAFDRADELQRHACALRARGEVEGALKAAIEARAILTRDAASPPSGAVLLLIGNCLADLRRYSEADEALTFAAETFLADGREADYAQAMIGRGRVLAERGDEGAALEFFLQLLNLKLPSVLQSQILNNLGVLYRQAGDFHQATQFLLRDLALCAQIGDRRGAAITEFNLASVRFEADDPEAGREYASRAARGLAASGMTDLAAKANALAHS